MFSAKNHGQAEASRPVLQRQNASEDLEGNLEAMLANTMDQQTAELEKEAATAAKAQEAEPSCKRTRRWMPRAANEAAEGSRKSPRLAEVEKKKEDALNALQRSLDVKAKEAKKAAKLGKEASEPVPEEEQEEEEEEEEEPPIPTPIIPSSPPTTALVIGLPLTI